MSRASPYAAKPPEDWEALKEQMGNAKLLLVSRSGPTVFVLQDEQLASYKVTLGNPHSCSCLLGASSSSAGALCVHKLYCVLKVLRIPDSHPLAWQKCYSDTETTQVLDGIADSRRRPRVAASTMRSRRAEENTKAGSYDEAHTQNEENGFVVRQVLSEEENENTCPVCQEDMTKDQMLSWCRMGCGNNIHASCMKRYAIYHIEHNKRTSDGKSVPCPLCRTEWQMSHIKEDCKGKASLQKSSAPIKCSMCSMTEKGQFYRCVECSCGYHHFSNSNNATNHSLEGVDTEGSAANANVPSSYRKPVDICHTCFTFKEGQKIPDTHKSHHFLLSEATVGPPDETSWAPTVNPRAPKMHAPLHILESLQGRELTAADYDLLLSFDKTGPTDLPTHLSDSLPVFGGSTTSNPNTNCWCSEPVHPRQTGPIPVSMGSADSKDGRLLCCGHVVHDNCLKREILEATADGDTWRLYDSVRCLHMNCNVSLFKGLCRKRIKSRKLDNTNGTTLQSSKSAASDIGLTSTNGRQVALGVGSFTLTGACLTRQANNSIADGSAGGGAGSSHPAFSSTNSRDPNSLSQRSQRLHESREATARLRLTGAGLEISGNNNSLATQQLTSTSGSWVQQGLSQRDISPIITAPTHIHSPSSALNRSEAGTAGRSTVSGPAMGIGADFVEMNDSRPPLAGRRSKVGQFRGLRKPPLPLSLPHLGQNSNLMESGASVALGSSSLSGDNGITVNGRNNRDLGAGIESLGSIGPVLPSINGSGHAHGRISSTLRTLSASSAMELAASQTRFNEYDNSSSQRRRSNGVNNANTSSIRTVDRRRLAQEELNSPTDMGIGGVALQGSQNNSNNNSNASTIANSTNSSSRIASSTDSRKRIVRGSTVRRETVANNSGDGSINL